jgi:hypothetical protein
VTAHILGGGIHIYSPQDVALSLSLSLSLSHFCNSMTRAALCWGGRWRLWLWPLLSDSCLPLCTINPVVSFMVLLNGSADSCMGVVPLVSFVLSTLQQFLQQHDIYENMVPATVIRPPLGFETGTKLYISNLDYGVSNDDLKVMMLYHCYICCWKRSLISAHILFVHECKMCH